MAGIFAAVWLIIGCAPTVWWLDDGQLNAAIFTNGIAHPTGFPVPAQLARLFVLIPFGSVAWKIHIFCALCGAATIGLLIATIRRLVESDVGATIASVITLVILLLSPTFLQHALATEVYAPSGLAIAASLYLAVRSLVPQETRRCRILLAFVTALGVGSHLGSFVPVSAAIWGALLLGPGFRRSSRDLPLWVISLVLGLAAYAYLPIAAANDPFRNWGSPSTLPRFLDHVTGATIRMAFEGDILPTSLHTWGVHATRFSAQIAESLGLLPLLSVLGIVSLRHHSPRLPWLVLGALVADILFSVGINPMGIAARQTAMPTLLLLTFAAGIGAWRLGTWTHTRFQIPPAVPALAAAALAGLLGPGLHEAPRSLQGDSFPSLYRDALLRPAPPGARVFTSSDDATGILAYAMGVEGARPDVAAIALAHLYDVEEWHHLQRLHGTEVIPENTTALAQDRHLTGTLHETTSQLQVLETLIGPAAGYPPALWELGEGPLDQPLVQARLMGSGFPLRTLMKDGDRQPPTRPEHTEDVLNRWSQTLSVPRSESTRRVLSEHMLTQARLASQEGRLNEAIHWASNATREAQGSARAWTSLGALLARKGDVATATTATHEALQLNPLSATAHLNMARHLRNQGDFEDARRHASRVLELTHRPIQRASAEVELGLGCLGTGSREDAKFHARRALVHRPGFAPAQELMHMLSQTSSME